MKRTVSVAFGLIVVTGVAFLGASRLPGSPSSTSKSKAPAPQAPAAASAPAPSQQRALIDKYCVGCHNDRAKTGNLTLQGLNVNHVAENAATWEKVVRKLRSGSMPPPAMPRPDPETANGLVSYLETSLDKASAAAPNPGGSAIHRLNRAEYTNAIRDLLSLELDGRALLPSDEASYGFDNIADVLSVSPALLERYLSAAQKISRLAVGDPTLHVSETYKTSYVRPQDDRMSEDLPFGTRGGLAARHYFPLDGEYLIKIRLQRGYGLFIRGIQEENTIDLRVDGERVKRITLAAKKRKPGDPNDDVEKTIGHDVEARVPVKAGMRVVGAVFVEKRPWVREGLDPAHLPANDIGFTADRTEQMGIETLEVDGPYNATGPGDTPSRRAVFSCRPASASEEKACATTILSRLARRAYRRPVTAADVTPLLDEYRTGRSGGTFESGIQQALEVLLASPDFLFRKEGDSKRTKAGGLYALSGVELASRLSFFIWSSLPDEELLELATRGSLSDPKVLDQQVRRLLADPRSRSLTDNFAGQWLYLRNMRAVSMDPETFPSFDESLREAFQRETELFFSNQVRDNQPIPDLLGANYTFLNQRLAAHYGVPNVYGTHFRRVTFSDARRGGLLGQGSVLSVTSYPTRTSPVKRGKWILENLLGTPPPAPPPNVPALEETSQGKALSMRDAMAQHRKNPVCSSCHAVMDPLGLSLENFDATGRWRHVTEADTPVDATGTMPDGTKFAGLSGLRGVLMTHPAQFVSTVTEKMLIYALGRGVEYYDMPTIRGIVREAAANDYRWSSIVLGIVKSTPFQKRRTES